VELGPEEIEIRLSAKEGFAAASEGGRVVVLDTTITDALKRSGLAREVVSALEVHAGYVAGEVLGACSSRRCAS
jgi:isoleucyl-tRNA synthetase